MTFFQKKTVRYFTWLAREFVLKYKTTIFLSAFISTIIIISSFAIFPHIIVHLSNPELIIGYSDEPTLDTLPDEIGNKISNGLLFVDNQGEIYPLLTSSWEKLNNGLTFRFHIKKDLLWDNNNLFTVKDINYQFKDVVVKRSGDFIIEYTLQKPFSSFPLLLTKPIIKYPYHGVGGLYKVQRITEKQGKISELRLIPNKKDLQPITYRFYKTESQLVTAYKLGLVHQITVSKKITAEAFSTWKNTQVTKKIDYTRLFTLFFNFNNPLFKERELRSGINTAIDRTKILEDGSLSTTSITPLSWAYNKTVTQPNFDLPLAQKIIQKYLTASDSSKLNVSTYYEYLDIADKVNSDLNSAGISTNLNVISSSNTLDFDILLTYMKVSSDPDQYYYWHSSQNLAKVVGYKNLKVDKLLEDARTIDSLDERRKIYADFQKTIDDDVAAVFLFYPYVYSIKRI